MPVFASRPDSANAPDTVNGLNHVWQNYVLGLKKGEKNGRIWINSVQTDNAGTIRLFTQPLIPVQASGFSVKVRTFTGRPSWGTEPACM